jgi:peptide/nickel transport system substrate-binding protein
MRGNEFKDQAADWLLRGAQDGRVSRRQFMEGALALGMSVSAASALWSRRVEAATPKQGGTYRVAVHEGSTTDQLDPGTTESVYMIQMNHAFRSYLTEITNTNEIGPDAAESWEASDDAVTWTFRLFEGMEFHDGKPFTADDAVASLNYHRGEDSKSAAKALLEDVEEIKADGPNTVVITMKSGNADLPYLLSDYHLVMMPSDGEGNVDWQSGNGTGPFKIESHDPGVRSDLARHPNYHKSGQPYFDAVTMIVVHEANARQTALITGDFDAISDVDLKTVRLLGRDPNIEVDEVPSGAHCTIPMFCDTAPFDNADVRLALKYAIDRDEIVQKILLGHGTKGNDHPIGPTLPYYAELEQREYDPDKARHHLKKAGAEGLTVSLSTADFIFSGAVDMAVLYKVHAAKAGINLEVVREPNDGYWSNVWLVKPFVVVQWGARPTPDVMFSLAYKDDAAWNESHWQNEQFNKILREAKAELNQEKRTEMYREMQQLCRDDGGTVVPFFRNRVYARRSNVMHGPDLAGNWELDGARSFQRWWFA